MIVTELVFFVASIIKHWVSLFFKNFGLVSADFGSLEPPGAPKTNLVIKAPESRLSTVAVFKYLRQNIKHNIKYINWKL